jgi:hypothetical protein
LKWTKLFQDFPRKIVSNSKTGNSPVRPRALKNKKLKTSSLVERQYTTKTAWRQLPVSYQRKLGAFKRTPPGPSPPWRVTCGQDFTLITDAIPISPELYTWEME